MVQGCIIIVKYFFAIAYNWNFCKYSAYICQDNKELIVEALKCADLSQLKLCLNPEFHFLCSSGVMLT